MFWNHRLMQRTNDPGTTYEEQAIYVVEVYYHDDGGILGWTEKEDVWGNTVDEIRQTLHWMLDATEKPVLDEAILLAQAEEAREAGRESLWPEDIITPEDRISLDEVLDSLGLEREDLLDTWEDDGGRL